MKRTISLAKGKGSIGHNNRDFKAENVDANRSQFNTCYINEDLKDVYHKLFDDALEKYNAKQKRNDRKIPDYYEKIRTAKQENLFYEIIVQVGNFEDMHTTSENGKLAEEILQHYMSDFQKHNPNLYVFSAHLHMDEATPHLHIDFVPYTSGNNRGLETKNSLKSALEKQGFKGGTRGSTELAQWQDSEKEIVAKLMLKRGIEWDKKGGGKKHLPIEQHKAEQRALEVVKLDEKIIVKNEVIDELNNKTVNLTSNINSIEKQSKKAESRLKSLQKQEKAIITNVYKYEEDEEWQLPEPAMLMTANTYKDKKAMPLVEKLKSVIKSLIIQMVQIKDKYNTLVERVTWLDDKVKYLTSQVEKGKEKTEKYNLIEKILGKDRIDGLIEEHKVSQSVIEPVKLKKTRDIR